VKPFADHFSQIAARYAVYRPHYPDALFSWLASIAPDRERAWDCATGNGQAAVALSRQFAHVIATIPVRRRSRARDESTGWTTPR